MNEATVVTTLVETIIKQGPLALLMAVVIVVLWRDNLSLRGKNETLTDKFTAFLIAVKKGDFDGDGKPD